MPQPAQDESRKQALEKAEWTNQFYALKLTSKGLVVDPVALKDSLQQASSQSKVTEAPSQSENAEGEKQAVQLPASIPASLDLSFELDASKWNRADAGADESAPAHDAVVPGDWVHPGRCPRALRFRMKPPSSTCSRTMMGQRHYGEDRHGFMEQREVQVRVLRSGRYRHGQTRP